MARDFSKSRQYEKLGARIMAPIYALFQRPVAALQRPAALAGTKSNTRLLDDDHRFMSRGLQRLGIDYALCLPDGPNPYRFADEKADRFHTTGNFALEELTLTEQALVPSMLHTARAGFLVYLFPASLDIYFIPLEPTRAYVEANRSRFTTTSVGNPTYLTFCTLVPIGELLAAVPEIRHIHASWFADWASVGKKREPRSLLPAGCTHQSIQFSDLLATLRAMPARRKASTPSLGCAALLHHMTLRDKQRQSNAGHYTKLGLYNLVQDIVPANRFGFAPFTPAELAQSVGQAGPDDGIDPLEPDFEPALSLLETK
jgi:hypothetical protein